MENNLLLSPKVKKYFVYALKGIGIRGRDAQKVEHEMTESEINAYLDQATPQDVFAKIAEAARYQLQKDAQNERRLQKCSAYKRNTIVNAVSNNDFSAQGALDLSKENALDYVNSVCDSNDASYRSFLSQTVIETLKAGIREQGALSDEDKDVAKKLREEALVVWDKISNSELDSFNAQFKQRLNNAEFNQKLLRVTLYEKTVNMFGGNKTLAENFLNSKFDAKANGYLKVNEKILEGAKQNCKNRGAKEINMNDVMLSLMQDYSVEQTITYIQTRSQEQKDLQKNGDKTITRENKIGNLMGKDGRKMVDRAAINYDNAKKKSKKGKKMWLGYKKIYDRILNFVRYLLGGAMLGGWAERVAARRGFRFLGNKEINKEKIDTTPWEIEMEKDPRQLNNQDGDNEVAKKFYEKTKARLLSDKMRVANLQVLISNPLTLPEKQEELGAQDNYLKQRIKTAEEVIQEIKSLPVDDPMLQEPKYFELLETRILNEKCLDKYKVETNQEITEEIQGDVKSDKSVQQDKQEQQEQQEQKEQKEILSPAYVAVEKLIKADKNQSANAEMGQALLQFKNLCKGTMTPVKARMKIAMSRELFGIPEEKLSDKDLNEMTDRFVDGKLKDLRAGLTTYDQTTNQTTGTQNESYQVNVKQAFSEINSFIKDDLKQNAMAEKYQHFIINENRKVVIEDVSRELGR